MPSLTGYDVSRETISKLEAFSALLLKWNKSINLISKSTVPDIWNRHINDSAQIINMAPKNTLNWLDVGSGGGLPGIVVAIILQEQQPDAVVTLVESDQRKSAFLRTAIRTLEISGVVLPDRAELVEPMEADILSARALMPLDGLLDLGNRHLKAMGKMIVLKGKTAEDEIAVAKKNWQFDVVAHPSLTDNQAKVLEIGNIKSATT